MESTVSSCAASPGCAMLDKDIIFTQEKIMKNEIPGRVEGVYLGTDPGTMVSTAQSEVQVTLEGFVGDSHCGLTRPSDSRTPYYPRGIEIRNSRQITILSLEEMTELADELGVPVVRPEWLGANLLVSGLPQLTLMRPGLRFYFENGPTLVIEGENLPCKGPGKVLQEQYPAAPDLVNRFRKAALHRRGVTGWVERAGVIHPGDAFKVFSLQEVFAD